MPPRFANESKPAWAEIGQNCLAVRIRVLSRAVTAIFDEVVRKHQITVPQMNLLACIASLGEARPGTVSNVLHMDHSTTSRNLERMMANGWLEYVTDADGRAKPIRVTSKGRKLMEKALPDWRIAQKKAKQFLGDETAAVVTERVGQIWADQRQ